MMRRVVFWTGWAIVFLLPIALLAEIWWRQDLPLMHPWKYAVILVAVALIIAGRNRDDVLKHHLR